MTNATSEPFIRDWVGLEGESLFIGTVTLSIFTAVFLMNGNTNQFSLLAGAGFGVFAGVLRYIVLLRSS